MPKGEDRYLRLQRLIKKHISAYFRKEGVRSGDDIYAMRDDAISDLDPRLREAGEASGMLDKVLSETWIPLTDKVDVRANKDDTFSVRRKNKPNRQVEDVRVDKNGRYRDERGRFL